MKFSSHGVAIKLSLSVFLALTTASWQASAKHQWDDFHRQSAQGAPLPATVNAYDNIDYGSVSIGSVFDNGDLVSSVGEWNGVIGGCGGVSGVCIVPLTSSTSGMIGSFTSQANFDDVFRSRAEAALAVDGSGNVLNDTIANIYAGDYTQNGWLGVAIIDFLDPDPHIVYSEVYLNDSYFNYLGVAYNTKFEWNYVFCQELGHVLGLDHIKRDQSCMYSNAANFGSNDSPNGHDGGMVNDITHDAAHTGGDDGGNGGNGGGGGGGGPPCGTPNGGACSGVTVLGKAFWAERFESQAEMFDSADLVAKVKVLKGSAFDRLVGPAGQGLPVSRVVLQVDETFSGASAPVIFLEQTRGGGLEIEDDPGYVAGDHYTLYLRQLDTNTYRIVHPIGRIRQ